MLRAVTLGALILLVAAGAARAGLFTSDWEEARDKATACFDAVDANPAYQAINAKTVRSKPTLAQLGDETFPTDADVAQLQARDQDHRACRDMYLAAMRKEYPALSSALSLRYYQGELVMLQLTDKRITFANANKLFQESYLQYRLHADMYFEMVSDRQRQAMAQSLSNMSRQLNSAPRPTAPRSMRCSWIGPTLYCDAL